MQVLFCSLTGEQRDLYRAYLSSEEVQDILNVSPYLPFHPSTSFVASCIFSLCSRVRFCKLLKVACQPCLRRQACKGACEPCLGGPVA